MIVESYFYGLTISHLRLAASIVATLSVLLVFQASISSDTANLTSGSNTATYSTIATF